jgi:16S rRNA processing protein RimM
VTAADESGILVGVVGRPRGNRGEVHVNPHTDFPDIRFQTAGTLAFRPEDGEDRQLVIEQCRWIKDRLVVKFEGIDSISAAETLRGGNLLTPESDAVDLPEGSYFHDDLVGLVVVDEAGQRLGTVSGLMRTGAGDILEVEPAKGEGPLLIPAVEEICYDVDLSEGLVRVRLPEGLLEINR